MHVQIQLISTYIICRGGGGSRTTCDIPLLYEFDKSELILLGKGGGQTSLTPGSLVARMKRMHVLQTYFLFISFILYAKKHMIVPGKELRQMISIVLHLYLKVIFEKKNTFRPIYFEICYVYNKSYAIPYSIKLQAHACSESNPLPFQWRSFRYRDMDSHLSNMVRGCMQIFIF